MTVTPLEPDTPIGRGDIRFPFEPDAMPSFGGLLLRALQGVGEALGRANEAERAFVGGRGGLREMMVERAQADVALSLAATAASRTAQAVSTVLGMQV